MHALAGSALRSILLFLVLGAVATAGEPMDPTAFPDPPTPKAQGPLMVCRNLTKGSVVASRLVVANTPSTRSRGLLGRRNLKADEGMLLIPCRSIHTLGMKFALDVVFVSKQMRVVDIRRNVPPGRPLLLSRRAYSTLELAAGVAADRMIEIGDLLQVEPPPPAK